MVDGGRCEAGSDGRRRGGEAVVDGVWRMVGEVRRVVDAGGGRRER